MEISVHDNTLLSYCVSSERREIRLHTVYDEREPWEYTDVVFSGVVAYCFDQDNLETIIFDVVESDVSAIYAENKERFTDGRKHGWPGSWNASEQATLDFLAAHGIRGFTLSSSYGMHGWVMAQSMSKTAVSAATP